MLNSTLKNIFILYCGGLFISGKKPTTCCKVIDKI